MYQHSNSSSTLPRDFRFHHDELPTTPEPQSVEELKQPSPPRPAPRLKVRRRVASSFQAPTAHFLASVAAADVPIPTIEEPLDNGSEDCEMTDQRSLSIQTSFLSPQPFRAGSPPRTPMPTLPFEDGVSRHQRDWSAVTSPSDYFQRPMSAQSATSDFSDDSFYSGGRVSRPSDSGSCTSPDSEDGDPFTYDFPKGKGSVVSKDRPSEDAPVLNAKLRSKTRNDAPWTHAQSAHLWKTYNLYLSDATVTPFRIGHSAVPPQGIIHRVCREAKRSWKGPKLLAVRKSSRLSSSRAASLKSGSITPTAESPRVYAPWPHSSNLTRAHLRELCKLKDSNPVQRHHHLQSRSPTPFTKPYKSRLHSVEPRDASFATKDIAVSLATSTAISMQPHGPLAQLAAEEPDKTLSPFPSFNDFRPRDSSETATFNQDASSQLMSPFAARTYGPSSTKDMAHYRLSPPRHRSGTVVPPRLGSPMHFTEARSFNGTTKRRAQNALDEEHNPNGSIVIPSVLNDQLFGGAYQDARRRVRIRGFSLGDETLRHRAPGVFQRLPLVSTLPIAHESSDSTPATLANPPQLLPPISFGPAPPRLGSPFCESGPSKTFPRRLFPENTATVRRSAFATMHQTHQVRHSIEAFDFGDGPSLESKLFNISSKLKEFDEQNPAARRE